MRGAVGVWYGDNRALVRHWEKLSYLSPSRRKAQAHHEMAFDWLEKRLTLSAGASLAGGNLTIVVTGASESLSVSQPAPNEITLSDAAGISYNGTTATVQTIKGVTKDMTYSLLGGSDTLIFDETNSISVGGKLEVDGTIGDTVDTSNATPVNSLSVAKDLTITEQGGSSVTLTDINVEGNARFDNSGTNSITLDTDGSVTSANTIGHDLQIQGGKGAGTFFFTLGNNNIGGSVQFQGGDGNDVFVLNPGASVQKDVNVQLGKGSSLASISGTTIGGNTNIQAGDGDNTAAQIFGAMLGKELNVKLGKGNSGSVTVSGTTVGGNTNIQEGDGAGSTVTVDNTTFYGDFNLQTGKGANTVNIGDNSSDVIFNGNVQAKLGSGNDTLNLGSSGPGRVTFAKNATFDGQEGTNTLNEANITGTVNGSPLFKNFQIQNHF